MPRKACGTDHPRHVLSLPPPAARPHRCGRALAAAVPAAHADSISYVKDADVHLTTPTAAATIG